MTKLTRLLTLILTLALMGSFTSCANDTAKTGKKSPPETTKINIATGEVTGDYYNVGEALSGVLIAEKIELTPEETGGSVDNMDLILQDRADLAISMLDVATEAYGQKETSDSAIGTDLRVMKALYPNVIQVITTEDTGIKNFRDLKYKRVGVGAENSGVECNAKLIFSAFDMSYKDCEIAMVDTKKAVSMIKEGELDAAFASGTIPDEMINEIEKDKKKKLVLIPITGKERQALIKKYPAFQESTIPENSYGKNKTVETVSVMNMLFANKNLDDKIVQKILKTIESKVTELEASMGSTDMISMENPKKFTDIPLHSGAKAYIESEKEVSKEKESEK